MPWALLTGLLVESGSRQDQDTGLPGVETVPGQLGLEVLEAHPAGRSVEAEGEGGQEVGGFAWRFSSFLPFKHFHEANRCDQDRKPGDHQALTIYRVVIFGEVQASGSV